MSSAAAPGTSGEDQPYVSAFASPEARETNKDKYVRKVKSNPFVPAFVAMAGVCLIGGFWAYRTGRQRESQLFQRGRVGFQGAAVAALLAGVYMDGNERQERQDGRKF